MNWEQNDWAQFLPIVEFVYNNSKNASMGHTPFKLNCGYHLRMLYKKEVDPWSQFMSADKLLVELRELMIVCQKNLQYTQEL